mmetsp:Transcript_16782/g.34162  ORF Transcript_16782/g.34162 Transcript_16782/m.34162 type:complete len:263 (-) Transcript_16782:141-929(-)
MLTKEALATTNSKRTMTTPNLHNFDQHIPTLMAQSDLSFSEIDKRPFPLKLFNMLEIASELGFHQSLSWTPDGKSFVILNREKFMCQMVPLFFKQTKFRSFTRQLNIWGFEPTTFGYQYDRVWRNKYFIRDKPELLKCMERVRVKSTRNPLSSTPMRKSGESKMNAANKPSSGSSTKEKTVSQVNKHEEGIKENKNAHICLSCNLASSTDISDTDFRLSYEVNQFPTIAAENEEAVVTPKPLTESDIFEPEEVLQFLITYFE